MYPLTKLICFSFLTSAFDLFQMNSPDIIKMDAEKATIDPSEKGMLNRLNSEENQKRNSTCRDVFLLIMTVAYISIGAYVSETLLKIRILEFSKYTYTLMNY